MWAGLRVEISCFSTTSTDALNMVGTAVQPVIVAIGLRARCTNNKITIGLQTYSLSFTMVNRDG